MAMKKAPRKIFTEAEKAATPLSDEFMADAILVKELKDLATLATFLPEAEHRYKAGIAAVRDACNVLIGQEWDKQLVTQQKEIADLTAKLTS